jgi:Tol biopolymer transport system component
MLVVLTTCGGASASSGPEGTGSIEITTTTTGQDIDPDGYTAAVDAGQSMALGINATVLFSGLSPRSHSVQISGIARNCTVVGQNPRTVTVASEATAQVPVQIICAAISGLGGTIAFNTDRDGDFEIYLVYANGTGLARLTNFTGDDAHASWSPDGSRIAFHSNRTGDVEIYAMNADGTNPMRLTSRPGIDQLPAWSPDGSKIAFVRDVGSPFFGEIFVMNDDGTGAVNITNNADFALTPAWSPDGTRIAYTTDRDYDIDPTELATEIYVLNADGTQPLNITNHNTADDGHPAWSPDGSRIAFHTNRDGNFDIYVMNADGSNPVNLTKHAAQDFNPAWSPDGSKIAFETDRDGNFEIYVMTADGTYLVRVTNYPATDAFPAWRP